MQIKEKEKSKPSEDLMNCIIEGIKETKAKDVVILDLREIENAATDYFIICSGESNVQIQGICDTIVRFTRKSLKQKPWHQEGKTNSEWILLDYVNVVVHIFYEPTREYYDLEDLWADAIRTDIPNIA